MSDTALRAQLVQFLDFHDAHVDFDAAIDGVPPELRSVAPEGSPHSLWQLLEHLRITQHDILEFWRNPGYKEMTWPDDYWPASAALPSAAPPSAAPPGADAWDESIAAFRRDREELKQRVADSKVNLFAAIPHGTGQTYLREALLVADHNAYHIGQLVSARRQLGIWPPG